ncbi:HmuY family protein [Flammeovirgaceae bacterium SG7u.111]|nr:HmuY family protein [Flammeovirgaceae bacterium SG7u.132]WPO37921.1 HmuY family protein [Flammeovirgaceae bacterium SG7u.111]
MKKQLFTILIGAVALLTSCGEDDPDPLFSGENEVQVSLYSKPDVTIQTTDHSGNPIDQTLSYNRQVFVDLDAVSETTGADTMAVHYSDASYTHFDLWTAGADEATGSEGWDIVLAWYNGKAFDPSTSTYIPYMMTGALINKGVVQALKLNKEAIEEEGKTFISYDDVTFDDAEGMTLSADVAAIGEDWKKLNFSNFQYEMVADQYYIIKSTNGVYFKLAFTGFYSDNDGTKGFPKFKFERILAE